MFIMCGGMAMAFIMGIIMFTGIIIMFMFVGIIMFMLFVGILVIMFIGAVGCRDGCKFIIPITGRVVVVVVVGTDEGCCIVDLVRSRGLLAAEGKLLFFSLAVVAVLLLFGSAAVVTVGTVGGDMSPAWRASVRSRAARSTCNSSCGTLFVSAVVLRCFAAPTSFLFLSDCGSSSSAATAESSDALRFGIG